MKDRNWVICLVLGTSLFLAGCSHFSPRTEGFSESQPSSQEKRLGQRAKDLFSAVVESDAMSCLIYPVGFVGYFLGNWHGNLANLR